MIKVSLATKGVQVKTFQNPYQSLSKIGRSMFYFKKNQGQINHITGDIHWACLLLDPKKTVLTIHDVVGFQEYQAGIKRNLYMFLWFYLPLRKLKHITVISQKTKNELVAVFPKVKDKIAVVPNPLTVSVFKREPADIKESDIRILIVGTRENKNVPKILEALKDTECSLTILGKTDEAISEKLANLKAKITQYDFVSDEDLAKIYSVSDILCFASLYEGFGMPVIEAQASGCAVITSKMEPMISVAGEGAVFVNPLDAEDIKTNLLSLMNDFELRSALVKKGYENVQRFSVDNVAEQYLEIYKEILNG
ncbi:glycosyltransferase family 4 protein [Chryseobacterium caseinilyticum]|uniref:Glycosyltransferase family 4 protein n=1 Tax=Chryseobacterium caseinilyticum TaxID=2771428 RepID=A0ABR8ZB59_9FLAO|nr:glycosyltransferase family 1 protein [Chryseobacterium caseinilyticum]MBD8082319.1 glycosyltransferase family 4 protein [Chryseobacterium caseinilyticum]